jgi:pyruvate/oxaloacetate carboxyltransferase
LRIAKLCKPHTVAENLILPAAIDMVKELEGSEDEEKLKDIPLSNNTMFRRIYEMGDDVCEQFVQKNKKSDFIAIRFDELNDVFNLAQFSCFVRYILDKFIKKNVVFCKPVPAHKIGQCLFHFVS